MQQASHCSLFIFYMRKNKITNKNKLRNQEILTKQTIRIEDKKKQVNEILKNQFSVQFCGHPQVTQSRFFFLFVCWSKEKKITKKKTILVISPNRTFSFNFNLNFWNEVVLFTISTSGLLSSSLWLISQRFGHCALLLLPGVYQSG